MSATQPSLAGTPLPEYAGVYAAKPHRLIIGPLLHLEHFLTAPAGTRFGHGDSVLAAPSCRYVVDCAPHLGDLPPMPTYATVPSPLDSKEAMREPECVSTPTQPTPSAAAAAAAAGGESVCPATMSLHADPVPSSRVEEQASLSPEMIAAMPRSEVLRRMHQNAAEAMARLRQRCEHNGMSTAAFAGLRWGTTNTALADSQPSSPTPDAVDAHSGGGLSESLSVTVAAAAVTESISGASAVTGAAAEGAPSTANTSATAVATGTIAALPRARAELVKQAERNDALHSVAVAKLGEGHVLRCVLPNTDTSFDSAQVQSLLERLRAIYEAQPEAQVYVYSLSGKETASAVAALYLVQVDRLALSEVLTRRLPASTPRVGCLVQLFRLDPQPECFDRPAYLRLYFARRYPAASPASIEAAVSTCNGDAARADRLVRLDMSFHHTTMDLAAAARGPRRRSSCGTASPANTTNGLTSLSNASSAAAAVGQSRGSPRGLHAYASSADANNSFSDFSLCSSIVREGAPPQLTEIDETIIDSLYHALLDGRVNATLEEVRERYVASNRSQDAVLRHYLLRFRPSDLPSTPPKVRPSNTHTAHHHHHTNNNNHNNNSVNNMSSTLSDCATPTSIELEDIALAQFPSQSASQWPSSATRSGKTRNNTTYLTAAISAAAKTSPSEVCPSPEPKAPSSTAAATPTASASTPRDEKSERERKRSTTSPVSRPIAGLRTAVATPEAARSAAAASAVSPAPSSAKPKRAARAKAPMGGSPSKSAAKNRTSATVAKANTPNKKGSPKAAVKKSATPVRAY